VSVSIGEKAPVEEASVALGRTLRAVIFCGRSPEARLAAQRVALGSALEVVATVPTTDPRSFVEVAQALRDAAPDVVLVRPGDAKDIPPLTDLLETLRLGCAEQRPPPRVLALAERKHAEQLRPSARPLAFEAFADAAEINRALREERRGASGDLMLRDELIENAARALASSSGTDALAIDVSERSTSLALAGPRGRFEAAHVLPLGLGEAADHVVARGGLDRVRRWLPWPIDAPALLERVFKRSRWPGAVPATEPALLLEMALAREAIAHALRDAELAGLDIAGMRAAPSILITGRAAAFPRAAQSLLVLVDGLEPTAVSTVFREPDAGKAERIAMVVVLSPKRSARLRFVRVGGRVEQRVDPGAFALVTLTGEIDVSARGADVRGHGVAGTLGVLIDARGRPLELPERDGERIPAVTRWHAALRATQSVMGN
jgi:hypothetical protein